MNLLKILNIKFTFSTENVLVSLGKDFVKLNPNWLSRASYNVTHYTAHNKHHTLKQVLLQHSWTYNDMFLLTKSTKL